MKGDQRMIVEELYTKEEKNKKGNKIQKLTKGLQKYSKINRNPIFVMNFDGNELISRLERPTGCCATPKLRK